VLLEHTQVDVTTGDGFAIDFDRWDMGDRALKSDPYRGTGFGHSSGSTCATIGSEGVSPRLHYDLDRVGMRRPRTVALVDLSFVSRAVSLVQGFGISNVRSAAYCMECRDLPMTASAHLTLYWKTANDHPVDRLVALKGTAEMESRVDGSTKDN